MAPRKEADGLATLQACINSTTNLIRSFQIALRSPISPHQAIDSPPQPLALLADSCKLLKAQTTKLSLLILNKPFTPSAIAYILNACSSGCLPAMMSALELCPPKDYSNLLHNHIKASISRILSELHNLVASIPQDERGIEPQSRDTLASTGVLWAECDNLVALAVDGIVSLAMQKVEEFHGLLKDAIDELEDWDPYEEDVESDTDSLSSQKQMTSMQPSGSDVNPNVSLETLSVVENVELRKRSLSTLRTIRLLYPALKKRRIAVFPNITSTTTLEHLPSLADIQCLDHIMLSAQELTETADEIAGALYESSEAQVVTRIKDLVEAARQCCQRTMSNWEGKEDDFTEWTRKYLVRLSEVNDTRRQTS